MHVASVPVGVRPLSLRRTNQRYSGVIRGIVIEREKRVGHISGSELGAVDIVERLDEGARFSAGNRPLVLAAHTPDDELKGQRAGAPGGINDRRIAKVGLMIGDARRIDFPEPCLFVGPETNLSAQIARSGMLHFRHQRDPRRDVSQRRPSVIPFLARHSLAAQMGSARNQPAKPVRRALGATRLMRKVDDGVAPIWREDDGVIADGDKLFIALHVDDFVNESAERD